MLLTLHLLPNQALNDNDVPAYNGTIPVTLEFSFPQGFNVTGCEIQLTGRTPGDSVYASIVQSESVPFKFIDHHRDGPALVFSMTGVVTEGSGSDTGSTTSTTLSTVSLPTASSTSSLDRGATTTSTQTQTSSAEPISKEESKAGASLGATALAGIGAGAGVAVVAIAAICFFFFWRARQKGRKGAADADEPAPNSVSEHKEAKVKVEELHGQAVAERGELYSPEKPQELGSGTQRHEIGGGRSMERIELP